MRDRMKKAFRAYRADRDSRVWRVVMLNDELTIRTAALGLTYDEAHRLRGTLRNWTDGVLDAWVRHKDQVDPRN